MVSEVSLHSIKFHILVNLHSTEGKRLSISNYIGVFFWISVYPILKEVLLDFWFLVVFFLRRTVCGQLLFCHRYPSLVLLTFLSYTCFFKNTRWLTKPWDVQMNMTFRRRQEIEDVYLSVMIIFGTPSTGNGNRGCHRERGWNQQTMMLENGRLYHSMHLGIL